MLIQEQNQLGLLCKHHLIRGQGLAELTQLVLKPHELVELYKAIQIGIHSSIPNQHLEDTARAIYHTQHTIRPNRA